LNGVFEPLLDPEYFARVTVDSEAGTIAWPDGLEIGARAALRGRPREPRRRPGRSSDPRELLAPARPGANGAVPGAVFGLRKRDLQAGSIPARRI
jgi:hypothetical protein